jgi:hypothetical protein
MSEQADSDDDEGPLIWPAGKPDLFKQFDEGSKDYREWAREKERSAYDFVHRHLDYMLRVWAMSIPTVALPVAAFGWTVSAASATVRLWLAAAATVFAVFFAINEAFLLFIAHQRSEHTRKKLRWKEGETFVMTRFVAVMIVAKLVLLLVLTWGIYLALPSAAAAMSRPESR